MNDAHRRLTLTWMLALGSVLVSACAEVSPNKQPAWQQRIERARRAAAAGETYVVVTRHFVWAANNNPRPFCYKYEIPGAWVPTQQGGLYRSKDGRAVAGVLFVLPQNLENLEGATLVERARTFEIREYEKNLGQRLAGVELTPFQSSRPGTWRLRGAPVTQPGRLIAFPAKIIVDFSPDAVAVLTVGGTADDDGLARRIIESLETRKDPECYLPFLEFMERTLGRMIP